MKAHEILGGLYVMINEEESFLLDEFFSEVDSIKATDLSERQQLLAEELVKKGVLHPVIGGFKLI